MKFLLYALCLIIHVLNAEKLRIDVSAPNAILMNADTGAILFEKSAHAACFPASITKVFTAYYALEKKGAYLDQPVIATENAIGAMPEKVRMANPFKYPPYRLEFGGSHMGIKAGEILSLRTLLYGLMLSSGNDAANVIAEYISGTVEKFMEELNTFLASKGIKSTKLYNPHGLPYPGHMTTAYEMAKISSLALKNPVFREIVKTIRYTRPQTNKQPETVLVQTNKLLKPGASFYPKAIGIKTGYSTEAGYTLVAAAQQEGRTLIAVLLNCQDLYQRYRDTIALFEAAFTQVPTSRVLFNKQYDHFSKHVKGGKAPLEAVLGEDLKITYYPAEEPHFSSLLHWHNVKMPILKNQVVGEIRLIDEKNITFLSAPLYAARDVPPTAWFSFTQGCATVKNFVCDLRVILILLMLLTTGIAIYHCRKPSPSP